MTIPQNPARPDPYQEPLPAGAGAGPVDDTGESTADTAKSEGRQAAAQAKEGGQQVAGVAKDEAGKVASSAGDQAKGLLTQGKQELTDQAGTQQQRLSEGLRSLGAELDTMAQAPEQSGPASAFARQASQRTQDVAMWLENHEPADALEEVKRFARRRPGTFVLLAAGVGVLAGRLTRGLAADEDDTSPRSGHGGHPAPAAGPAAPAMTPPPVAGMEPARPQPVGYNDDVRDDPYVADMYPETPAGDYAEGEYAPGRQDGPGVR